MRPLRLEFGPERDDRRLQFGNLATCGGADRLDRLIASLLALLEATAQGLDRLLQPGDLAGAFGVRLADGTTRPGPARVPVLS